ncbi:MAG: hypothetical protein RSE94_22490 [Pseudomonas sp.]
MPWYRTGKVAITAGQNTVTGTGTQFSANARVGDALQGPDGRWYEVTNITSATVLSILPAYQGATVADGSYGLAPMQGYVKESADRLRQIVNDYGGTLALFGGATTVSALLQNIGAAARGVNGDITSLTGLTTALSIAQGGTGGKTQSEAKTALGIGDIGVGQSWQNVTASRELNTTYTNNTGRPIQIAAQAGPTTTSGFSSLVVVIGGTSVYTAYANGTSAYIGIANAIIPPGATYRINNNLGLAVLTNWSELR